MDFSCLFRNDKNDDGKYDIENFRWMLSVISTTVYCTFIDCLEKKWKIGNYNLFEEEIKRCFILVDPVIDFCVNSIQNILIHIVFAKKKTMAQQQQVHRLNTMQNLTVIYW